MDLGYARVSTAKQDLDRQIDALTTAGIDPARIWVDKKSGATTDRPGLTELLAYARPGDVITVHTLDRLGRTVRDTLNLIHSLTDRGVGLRNLADPIKVDTANPADPMGQLAVVLLALFAQMERTYTVERAAHARAVATAKGKRVGRPTVVNPDKLAWAAHLRDAGLPIAEIVTKTGITRASLYRHLPPRPAAQHTAAPAADADQLDDLLGGQVASDTVDELAGHVAPTTAAARASARAGDVEHVPGQIALPLETDTGDRPAPAEGAVTLLPRPPLGAVELEAVDWPAGYSPPCPACTRTTTGIGERWARITGVREPVVVTVAHPCGCPVTEHAAALQAPVGPQLILQPDASDQATIPLPDAVDAR